MSDLNYKQVISVFSINLFETSSLSEHWVQGPASVTLLVNLPKNQLGICFKGFLVSLVILGSSHKMRNPIFLLSIFPQLGIYATLISGSTILVWNFVSEGRKLY